MADLQTIQVWLLDHQIHFTHWSIIASECLIVKFNITIICILNQLRHWQKYILTFFLVTGIVIFCTWMILLWLITISVIERFETRRIEGENERLSKATQRIYLQCSLHQIDRLPVGMARRFLEFIDKIKLTKDSYNTQGLSFKLSVVKFWAEGGIRVISEDNCIALLLARWWWIVSVKLLNILLPSRLVLT